MLLFKSICSFGISFACPVISSFSKRKKKSEPWRPILKVQGYSYDVNTDIYSYQSLLRAKGLTQHITRFLSYIPLNPSHPQGWMFKGICKMISLTGLSISYTLTFQDLKGLILLPLQLRPMLMPYLYSSPPAIARILSYGTRRNGSMNHGWILMGDRGIGWLGPLHISTQCKTSIAVERVHEKSVEPPSRKKNAMTPDPQKYNSDRKFIL